MDTRLISDTWDTLAGRRVEFTDNFYRSLFARDPRYRAMFPESMDAQRERMVEMWSSVARYADHIDLVRPYLLRVGFAHRPLGLSADDLHNFEEAFMEALAEVFEGSWDAEHEQAWREAFDDVVLPMIEEGMAAPTLPERAAEAR